MRLNHPELSLHPFRTALLTLIPKIPQLSEKSPPLKNKAAARSLPVSAPVRGGGKLAATSFLLGLFSMLTWTSAVVCLTGISTNNVLVALAFIALIPLLSVSISLLGIVFGVQGLLIGKRLKAVAATGVVLALLGLTACAVNMGIGSYQGATGQHPLVIKTRRKCKSSLMMMRKPRRNSPLRQSEFSSSPQSALRAPACSSGCEIPGNFSGCV